MKKLVNYIAMPVAALAAMFAACSDDAASTAGTAEEPNQMTASGIDPLGGIDVPPGQSGVESYTAYQFASARTKYHDADQRVSIYADEKGVQTETSDNDGQYQSTRRLVESPKNSKEYVVWLWSNEYKSDDACSQDLKTYTEFCKSADGEFKEYGEGCSAGKLELSCVYLNGTGSISGETDVERVLETLAEQEKEFADKYWNEKEVSSSSSQVPDQVGNDIESSSSSAEVILSSSQNQLSSSSSAYDPAGANGKPCGTEGEEKYVGPYVYVCKDGLLTFSEDLSEPCDADMDCGSNGYPEGWQNEPCTTEDEVRLDETFEYRCVGGKWSIQGYNPNLVDPNAERCRSSEIEGSTCDVSEAFNISENGCEYFCYDGKWEYTPPPM